MGLVDSALRSAFRKLGHTVSQHPKYFIISSIIAALALGTGFLQLNYESEYYYLYLNTRGQSLYEKATVETYFPSNYTGAFSPWRVSSIGRLARIIMTARDGGSIFRTKIWKEVEELDDLLHSIQITYAGDTFNYSRLCAQPREDEGCLENEFLDLGRLMGRIENASLRLSYPIMVNPETYNIYALPIHFSGLKTSEDNLSLVSAEALNANYFLNSGSVEDDLRGWYWEKEVTEALLTKDAHWRHIKVYHMTHYSIIAEQENNTLAVIPYFAVAVLLMCVFTICSTLSADWVTAKPWVAMFGIVAASLGSLSGFGLLCYAGVSCIAINLAVPFIMLGIGLDDSFVMLSAWRQTNPIDPVSKRLADTYEEAAVSITLTSLTDMLSFFVGIFTPIPAVQIFCAYAGTCVFFIFLFQIFCFGAVLSIAGDQEAGNRHSVFWWLPATPKSKADGKSKLFKLFFTGGIDRADPCNKLDNTQNAVMVWFRDKFAPFLAIKWVKFLVLVLFVAYLGVSTYEVLGISEGLKEERLYNDYSYMAQFVLADTKYFKRYQYRVQVAITTPLDYSQPSTQGRVKEILESLTNSSKFVSPDFGENWLTGFTNYVERYGELYEHTLATEQQFIDTLRTDYLPNNIFAHDVIFNDDGTEIIASRFILQLVDTWGSEEVKQAIVNLRKVAAAQNDVEVIIFNPWLVFVDQSIIIRSLTITLLAIAAAIVMVVSIIFIPNLITSLCIFFTIISTEWGVVGLMALWGLSLDMISIVGLVMCIGFSVDFSAHVAYAYVFSSGTPEERTQKAMYSMGLPILQGGGSTIIAVLVLVFVSSYIMQVFFKVVVLVILIAAFHSLFLLPVLLMIFKPESTCKSVTKTDELSLEKGVVAAGSVIPVGEIPVVGVI